MLLGNFEYNLDDRGRVAIPAKLRDEFKAGLILSRGFDRYIGVYPPEGWRGLTTHLASLPITQLDARRTQRGILSGAYEAELDRQGRVLLPATLRQYAEIRQSITIVGMGDHLELWATETWVAEQEILDSQLSVAAERLRG